MVGSEITRIYFQMRSRIILQIANTDHTSSESNVNELIEFFEQFEYNVTEDTFMGSWYMNKEEGKAKKKCKYCEKEGHYLFKSLKSSDLTCTMSKRHVELKKKYGADTRQHIVDKLAKYKIKA